MRIINRFLQEKTISYGRIPYSKSLIKKLEKKKYLSNGYYWVYAGRQPGGLNSNNLPYIELPLHVLIWNTYNPNDKIAPDTVYLIHHRNGNKLDNRIQNLVKRTIKQHNREHLTKRRKEMPDKFKSKKK